MKELYEQPLTEIIELTEGYGVMTNMDSEGETGEPMSKEATSFEESDDPLFEANQKNLWEE